MNDYELRYFWEKPCEQTGGIKSLTITEVNPWEITGKNFYQFFHDKIGNEIGITWDQKIIYTIFAPGQTPSSPPQEDNKPNQPTT